MSSISKWVKLIKEPEFLIYLPPIWGNIIGLGEISGKHGRPRSMGKPVESWKLIWHKPICSTSSTRSGITKLGLISLFISYEYVFVCTIRFTFQRCAVSVRHSFLSGGEFALSDCQP